MRLYGPGLYCITGLHCCGPSLDIRIWDFNQNQDVTGKSVPQGERLGFRIDTNMYPATDRAYRTNVIDASPTECLPGGQTIP